MSYAYGNTDRRTVRAESPEQTETAARRGALDLPFLFLVIIILCVGLVMVLSASYASSYYENGNATHYFVKQLLFAVSGLALMALTSRIRVSTIKWMAYPALLLSIGLLALVPFIGFGTEEEGETVKRWIDLGFTTFQPSEIAKLAVVMSFSKMICTFKGAMKTLKYGILPFAGVLVIIVTLLMMEPHISASVLIVAVGALLMFVGGVKWHWYAGGLALGGAAGYFILQKYAYASSRISTWLDPFSDPRGAGWQTIQSLYAIGSGGLLGLGLGKSRQKFLYLPEEHNDFIFAIVCEELGYIGALLILLLFAMLIIRGYWIALHARNRFSSLLVTGITTLFALQVFFNVAVVTNLVPCTGISLPLFSYGGTALWIQLVEMGMILSVSREIPVKKAG